MKDLEAHAEAILRAAGSSLKHYTMPGTREAILAAVRDAMGPLYYMKELVRIATDYDLGSDIGDDLTHDLADKYIWHDALDAIATHVPTLPPAP